MNNVETYLITFVLAGLVIWQLLSGKALDRKWRPSVDRDENPGMYWFVVCCQTGLLVLVLTTGKTSWNSASLEEQGTSGIQQRRLHALDMHRAGKLDEAIAAYDKFLQESANDTEIRFWRGMAHWKLEHNDLALQDFRRVIELDPANFEAYRSADGILSRQQRWDEILEIWDRYIAAAPANAEAYFERGGTNFHKGNLAAAQADAAKACELGKAEACPLAERLKGKP